MVVPGVGPQHIVLEKAPESLVFEVRHPDGTPLTEQEYLLLRDPLTAPGMEYDERLGGARAQRTARPVKLCAEGDSWVNILWPLSATQGYNETFVDVIARDDRFYINNLGWPGDEFKEIVAKKHYTVPIKSGIFDFFILSGGGNDFLGGGNLANFVKNFEEGNGSTSPSDYIESAKLEEIFKTVQDGYRTIIRDVRTWSPKTHILIHGYDHAVPRHEGRWMGTPFTELGFDITGNLPRAIIKLIVDAFYRLLEQVADEDLKVHLVNVRGCCEGHWHDELHPDEIGAEKVAESFLEWINDLRPPRPIS